MLLIHHHQLTQCKTKDAQHGNVVAMIVQWITHEKEVKIKRVSLLIMSGTAYTKQMNVDRQFQLSLITNWKESTDCIFSEAVVYCRLCQWVT
jgi:hypothetical protein